MKLGIRVFLLVFMAFGLFGCAQKATVINYVEYPSFFTQRDEYKTIVVGGFDNVVEPEKYSQLVASNLVAKVRSNGAYKIVDATKGGLDEAALIAKGRETDPNALVLTGTITNYGEMSSTDVDALGFSSESTTVKAGERYSANSNGNANYSAYTSGKASRKEVTIPVLNFSKAMYAKLNFVLTRVSDSEVVATDMVYAIASESGMFGLNLSDSDERLKRALDDLTTNAVYYLAPSNESMTIQPDEILLVQKYGTDSWENASKFTGEDTVRVVLALSPRVAFNDFQVILKAEKQADPIDLQNINYSGQASVFEYKAADLVAATGAENYTVQVVYNNKAISTKKFKIVNK